MPPNEAANGAANSTQETGGALRVRLGVQPRTFQKAWKRTFGYPFESGRFVTPFELETMEAKYIKPIEEKPEPKTRAKREPKQVESTEQHTESETPLKVIETFGRDYGAIIALSLAFILPTIASGINTFSVSHQLSKNAAVAYAILGMVSLTPILFIIARMERVGILVAVGVVVFEAFCNVAATYLSLMGGMVFMFGTPRGACSDFLQNVVELTESGHKQTAIGIAIVLAVLIAATQLTSFWGIKTRIK